MSFFEEIVFHQFRVISLLTAFCVAYFREQLLSKYYFENIFYDSYPIATKFSEIIVDSLDYVFNLLMWAKGSVGKICVQFLFSFLYIFFIVIFLLAP